jgi:hypothetical protein
LFFASFLLPAEWTIFHQCFVFPAKLSEAQVMQKMGKEEKTVDLEFEEARDQFNSMVEQIKFIHKNLEKMDAAISGMRCAACIQHIRSAQCSLNVA